MDNTRTEPGAEASEGLLRRPHFLLLIIVLFGAGLRLYELGAASLWYDEAASLYLGQFHDAQLRILDPDWNNEAPLYSLLVKVWYGFVQAVDSSTVTESRHDFLIRLLPCLLSILSIPLVYALALRLFQRAEAGVLAAFLFALSPFQIYYAQELRVYSWFVLVALVATWYLLRALDENQHRHWVALILALAVLTYSHFIAVWIIFTFNLYFLCLLPWRREQFWRWTGYMAVLMLLIAPALLMAWWMNQLVSQIEINWYAKPTPKTALITFKNFFAGYGFTPWAYWGLFTLGAGAVAAGCLGLLRRPRVLLLLLLLLVVPVAGNVLLWSVRHFSFYEHRLFIFSGVAAILLAGYGIALLRFQPLVCLSVFAFALFSYPCLRDLYQHRLHPLESHRLGVFDKVAFRDAARHISAHWQPNDLLAHDSLFSTYSMMHYLPVRQHHLDSGEDDAALYVQAMANEPLLRRHNLLPVPAAQATHDIARVWLVEPHGITFDDIPQSIPAREWLLQHGFQMASSFATQGLGVTLFLRGLAPPAPVKTPPPLPPLPEFEESSTRPNILIILLDSLRADHLGLYGYHRDTSPFLDHIGQEAVVFEQALSPSSYTRETVASLFTSRYPSRNPMGMGWYATPDPELPSFATLFKRAGYTAALFSLTPMLEGLTFYEGFDHAEFVAEDLGLLGYSASGQGPRLVQRTLEFIDEAPGQPFAAYLHFLDPHGEYDPPEHYHRKFMPNPPPNPLALYADVRPNLPELVAQGFGPGNIHFEDLVARYDGEIAHVDESIREIFLGLHERGVLKDTVVVVTSDHGEEFLEHGFVEHAWRLYRESIHVPLIIWAPGKLPAARIATPVSLVDLLPTLLTVQGVPLPEDLDGIPLLIQEEEAWAVHAPEGRDIFSQLLIQTRPIQHSVRQDEHSHISAPTWKTAEELTEIAREHRKLVQQFDAGETAPVDVWGPAVHEEFFSDLLQQHPLPPEEAPRSQALREALERLREVSVDAGEAIVQEGMTEELQDLIESIGYLGAASQTKPQTSETPEN